MTESELKRKLLYCGYDDMTDYLRDSPFNRCVYNVILTHEPKKPGTDIPMHIIFNEVYYQCVRIEFEDDPGSDLEHRYIEEETKWLGSREAALLVFSVVWGIIRRKHYRSFNEECFINKLYPLINDGYNSGSYQLLAHIIIKYTAGDRLLPPKRFRPMPCPVDELPSKPKSFWQKMTSHFSYKGIEKLITLYSTIEAQQAFFNKIESFCNEKEAEKANFAKLREDIAAGGYLRSSDEEAEYDEKIELTYKEELEELKKKYERQEERHQRDLYHIEYQYKEEIKELREMLERKKIGEVYPYEPHPYLFSAAEMINHVTEKFSKAGADEFCGMLYGLAVKHGFLDERFAQMIDEIVPTIIKRDKPQNNVDISNAGVVNINPQRAITQLKEVEK